MSAPAIHVCMVAAALTRLTVSRASVRLGTLASIVKQVCVLDIIIFMHCCVFRNMYRQATKVLCLFSVTHALGQACHVKLSILSGQIVIIQNV